MNKSTSEKIIMNINRLGNQLRKNGKLNEKSERPGPPMGPPGGAPMGPPMGPPAELRALLLLKQVKELHKPQISIILGLPPKAANQILDKLAQEGRISIRQDPEEEKKAYISITEAGLAKLDQDREEKRKQAEEFSGNLTEEEKETLLNLLEKLGR